MRNFFKGFFEKKVILKALTAVLFFFAVTEGFYWLRMAIGFNFGTSNFGALAKEVYGMVIPALITAFIFGTKDVLKRTSWKSLGKGLFSGGLFLTIAGFGIYCGIEHMNEEGLSFKQPLEVTFYILFVLCIGLSEELFMRGTVTELMLRRYGDTRKGTWISVIIGSLLFGGMHITNIFAGQGIMATLAQVVVTAFMGFTFNAVYVRHRNIYSVMILHALLDFFTIWNYGLISGNSIANVHSSSDPGRLSINLLQIALYGISGLIVMRRSKFKNNKGNVPADITESAA